MTVPTNIKIATWNVNSLRVRLDHLLAWLDATKPNIIALQETKLEDKHFQREIFLEAGYHAVFNGQKSYNGVAILSRESAAEVQSTIPEFDDPQRRILAATIEDVRVINLYVPNGQSVNSEKYFYKLDWMDKVTHFIEAELKKYPRLVVLGDFNIALEDRDVHFKELWQGHVLVSEAERHALQKMMKIGLQDSFRLFENGEGHYTWWDYRAGGFRRNNGLRIDHILLSEVLAKQCQSCHIDKSLRSLERPSDHVPVVSEFVVEK
jgi:exodeoxyribonuclease-3